MFTGYQQIPEKEEFSSWEQKHQYCDAKTSLVPVKGTQQQLQFPFQGTLFCTSWANCHQSPPYLYSSPWSLNSGEQDKGVKFQTTVSLGTEFISNQAKPRSFLVQTEPFILIQVSAQDNVFVL